VLSPSKSVGSQVSARNLKHVKRDGRRAPIVVITALACVVIAIGAGLEGRFRFAGPIFDPSGTGLQISALSPTEQPKPSITPLPQLINPGGISSTWAMVAVLVAILTLIGVVVIVLLWLRKRFRLAIVRGSSTLAAESTDLSLGNDDTADLPTLRRGLDLASDVLEAHRTPRDAIVRAWVGLQEAAEDSGVRRRTAETPTEFTTRVFSAIHADRRAANTLLALYLRVRFGDHPASSDDLRVAKDAVGALRSSWPNEGSP
jgi:Domain of unknown function (DUF4129)